MRSVGIPQNEHFGRATRKRDVSNPSAGFTAITCLGSQISIRMQTVTSVVLMQIFCELSYAGNVGFDLHRACRFH